MLLIVLIVVFKTPYSSSQHASTAAAAAIVAPCSYLHVSYHGTDLQQYLVPGIRYFLRHAELFLLPYIVHASCVGIQYSRKLPSRHPRQSEPPEDSSRAATSVTSHKTLHPARFLGVGSLYLLCVCSSHYKTVLSTRRHPARPVYVPNL